jgi:predicted metal-dependent peptidase
MENMSTTKGTATDISVTLEVDEQKVRQFRLDPYLVALMTQEPFFARILRGVDKVRTDKIPTAGVLAKDGDIKMWWNPGFVAALTPRQVVGLLKHECFHLAFEHTTTRRMDPHIIHNYATDLAINSHIPREELPEGGLVPGESFKALSDEDRAKMNPEAVQRYEAVSAKIKGFPKNMSSEWYFTQLMSDPEVKEAIQEANKPGGGEPGEGDGEGNGPPMPGSIDEHDGWDELTDEERELVKGKIRQAVESAVKECDASGRWGTVGGDMRKTLRELISKEIPWAAVLKQFCGMTRRANRRSNIRRLNRKYTGIHPGTQRDYTSNIAVYIDQSGSVGNDALELLFGELRSLARQTEFTVFHFDTEVDTDSETVWKKGRTPEMHRTRCGGTCFTAPSKHAMANAHRFDGYLILTDGEAADPGPSKLKRGWVIVPGRELLFKPSNRDFVISMKAKK